MPICPEDGAELERFTDEINAAYATFWECPAHGGRYVGFGLAGLIPVPKAVVSNPPTGRLQVTNVSQLADTLYFKNELGAELPIESSSMSIIWAIVFGG